jgi:hypothetical protein
MRIFLVTIILLFLAANLLSYSILESISGNYIQNLDARSAAMGQTGVVSDGRLFDIFINPANLSQQESVLGAQFGANIFGDTDDRSLPMYNSFDAYSGEGTYVSNKNYFTDLAFAAYYKYSLNNFDISAALSYRPFISFKADYFEEVRNNENSNNNNYPPVLANNYIESEGLINAAAFTLAADYKDFLQFGLEVAMLSGDSDLGKRIIWSDQAHEMMLTSPDSLVDFSNNIDREFSGMQYKIGFIGKINDRLQAGFSYQPQVEFDVSGSINDSIDVENAVYMYYSDLDSLDMVVHTDSIMCSEYISPTRIRAGVSYAPQNIMKTYFNADVEYVAWSEQNKLYDDQFNFFVGIEHILPNSIPIRIGFNYTNSYSLHEHDGFVFADKVTMPSFTTGTGFNLLSKFAVDVSLEYGVRQYEALDLFMDSYYDHENLWANYQYLNLQDRGWENPDTIKERLLQLKTSISYKW